MRISDMFSYLEEAELENMETDEPLLEDSEITSSERKKILDMINSKCFEIKRAKRLRFCRNAAMIAACFTIMLTSVLVIKIHDNKGAIPTETPIPVGESAFSSNRTTVTEFPDEIFIFKPKKGGGVGIGGGGSDFISGIGASKGNYFVNDCLISDNFKMSSNETVNIYKCNVLSASEEKKIRVKEFLNSYYNINLKKIGNENSYHYYDEKILEGYEKYNESYMQGYVLTKHQFSTFDSYKIGEFLLKNDSVSLTEFKKAGLKTAEQFMKEFSDATGQKVTYERSEKIIKTISYIKPDISSENGYLDQNCEIPLYKYYFRIDWNNGLFDLDVTDGIKGNLLWGYNVIQDSIKDSYVQYYSVTIAPDGQIMDVEFDIDEYEFIKSGEIPMFSLYQLENYVNRDGWIICCSNIQNDVAILDGISGFFYSRNDFLSYYNNTAGPYAIIDYHLASEPNKRYQFSLSVDCVLNNMLISTYDGLRESGSLCDSYTLGDS